jgi:hypothetical protein
MKQLNNNTHRHPFVYYDTKLIQFDAIMIAMKQLNNNTLTDTHFITMILN